MSRYGKKWLPNVIKALLGLVILFLSGWLVLALGGCVAAQERMIVLAVNTMADRLNIPEQGVTTDEMFGGLGALGLSLAAGYLGLKLKKGGL